MPVDVTFDELGGVLTVTFDQALVPGPVWALNWVIFTGTWRYPGFNAIAAADRVTVQVDPGDPDPSPSGLTYLAVPPDVVGLVSGQPAAAFTGYPWHP